MKIIIITSSKTDEKEIEVVNSMLENGLNTLHLRKPRLTTKELEDYIKKIPSAFHDKIVIHSHHELAGKYNLKGIHLTKTHRKNARLTWFKMKILGLRRPISSLIISTSSTKLSELYNEDKINSNYIFLSPIFDSLTGKFQSGFYEEGLKVAIQKSGKNIVARGGVDYSKVEKIHEIGFAGLALYSAMWEKNDPLAEYMKVIKKCNELGIKVE